MLEDASSGLKSPEEEERARVVAEVEGVVEDVGRVVWSVQLGQWDALLDQLEGDHMWRQLDLVLNNIKLEVQQFLFRFARRHNLLAQGCGVVEETPHPFACTASSVLWSMLGVMEDMAAGRRKDGLREARRMAQTVISELHELEDWMAKEQDTAYCSLADLVGQVDLKLLGGVLGEERKTEPGYKLVMAYMEMKKLLEEGC